MFKWPPPRRRYLLEVAVPASFLSTEPTLQLKTLKAGLLARACSIYRVDVIKIYIDRADAWLDADLLHKLLEYARTPPYLRRHLYPLRHEYQYAGLLPPLQLPTHGAGGPREGEYREALVLESRRGRLLLEAGLGRPVQARGRARKGSIVLVRIESLNPPRVSITEGAPVYRGYSVRIYSSLRTVVRRSPSTLIIATDKYGDPIDSVEDRILEDIKKSMRVLVLFGSPKESLEEIASREGFNLKSHVDYIVNTVPLQGTLTVRTEEAVHATLSVLNRATWRIDLERGGA
ncbi:MAG: hypothetical protein GXO09_00245 [Crenarchaeota archaeon]|nr:hypothetical protein [Thermoproteota archaeon]